MHEEPGWLTAEEEATLDEIAKTLRQAQDSGRARGDGTSLR